MKPNSFLDLKLPVCACLVALLVAGCGRTRTKEERTPTGIAALLPTETDLPGGWKVADTLRVFTGRELYDYINGGADLFLEYGFEEVAAGEYLTPGGKTIFINIYRMRDSDAAFGIFSVTRRVEYLPVEIGTMGARTDYQQVFCHGSYYIEAQAMETDSLTMRSMGEFCRAVDKKLEAEPNELPEALRYLPANRPPTDYEVFVRGPLGLNTRKYLSDENIFALSDSVPGVLVSNRMFEDLPEPQTILVVNYPDSAIAESVFGALQEYYQERAGSLLDGGSLLKINQTRLLFTNDRNQDAINLDGKIIKAVFGLTPPGKRK